MSVCVTYDKYLQPEQSERVLVDGDDSSVEENPLRLRSNRPQVGRDEERSRQNRPERHLELLLVDAQTISANQQLNDQYQQCTT